MSDKQVKRRAYVLIGVSCVALAIFMLRLVSFQLIQGEDLLAQAESNQSYTFKATAARGEIVDCYGRSLATNETSYEVVLNKLMLGQADLNETLRDLVEILQASGESWNDTMLIGQPDEQGHFAFTADDSAAQQRRLAALKENMSLQQYATADQVMQAVVKSYGLEGYEPAWQRILGGIRYQMVLEEFSDNNNFTLAAGVSQQTMATIKERSLTLAGVEIVESSQRAYPDGTVLPHILGSLGKITAEQWYVEDENGKMTYPLREQGYNMNDLIGQGGLEKVYESELRGKDGTMEIVRDSNGVIQSSAISKAPEPGRTVMLTVNKEFQQRVDAALESYILTLQQTKGENQGREANAGAVVVIDVKTGGILAASNFPSYDLNLYNSHYSDYASDPALPLYDRAFQGLYAPGSTYKPSVALAGLLNGIVDVQDRVDCTGRYMYYAPSYTPRCQQYGHSGPVNVVTALQHSCNIYFYDVGRRATLEKCAEVARALGLGTATGVEVGEAGGRLTSTEDSNYTVSLDIQSAIGQGNNAFTPVQLATYAATIANKGVRYRTHLVQGFLDTNTGEMLEQVEPQVEQVLEDGIGAFDAVEQGMVLMAQGNYTLANYPITLAAKTGTPQRSEVYKVQSDGSRIYYNNGVMVAYGPVEDPEIAVAIVLEYGGSGANCAPLMVDIFNAYYFDRSSSLKPDAEGTLLP